MDLQWSAADLAFRDEVRRFLDEKLTPELRQAGRLMTSVYADHEASMEWQRILHERGWAAPAWPVTYGGCDWSLTQHYIFSRESTLAGAPSLSPMGIRMVAHAIIAFGTAGAEGLLPAPHPDRRGVLLPGLLRTRGRVRTWRHCRWRPSTTAITWCAPAARSGRHTPARRTGCSAWCGPPGREEAAGHHVRADRHDLPGHPDPPAGDDVGRGDPEPGVLRRGPGAEGERARRDRRRLDRRQVSAWSSSAAAVRPLPRCR